MLVALAIMSVVLAMAVYGFTTVLAGQRANAAQNELDMDVRTAIERLRNELRLSDLKQVLFAPAGYGPYTAVSFPLAVDANGDGLIDMDAGGSNIVWSKTVIYHVWASTPNQLRRTEFANRYAGATVAERQQQLEQVVSTGGSSGLALNGETAGPACVVFENLFTWSLSAATATYDGYNATPIRDRMPLGSVKLGPGEHTVEFTVAGRNDLSTGRAIGVDAVSASASGAPREAEDCAFTALGGGPAASKAYVASGSWSGNHHLFAPCTANGQGVSVTVRNDAWEETNFDSPGAFFDRTMAQFDTSLSPADFVLCLDGSWGPAWYAYQQCNDGGGYVSPCPLNNSAVRVLVRGETLTRDGYGPILLFYKAAEQPNLSNFTIALADASTFSNTCQAVPDTMQPLVLYRSGVGNKQWSDFGAGETVIAMPATSMRFTRGQSFLVSYFIRTSGTGANQVWRYTDRVYGGQGSYVLTNALPSDTGADDWQERPDLAVVPGIYNLDGAYSAYPSNGVYESAVFDTGMNDGCAKEVYWASVLANGSTLALKARSGNAPDLSDAPAWGGLAALAAPGAFGGSSGRYLQFRAELAPNPSIYPYTTPKLRYVRFQWPGPTRLVDVAAVVTRGPNYGACQVTVDGKPLAKAIKVNLEIFKYARRAGGSSEQLRSAVTAEISPRNTTK
jgi:type II secretory pathway pseudopilin PulG